MVGYPGLVVPGTGPEQDLPHSGSRSDPDLPGLAGSVGLAGGFGVENQEATCHRQED